MDGKIHVKFAKLLQKHEIPFPLTEHSKDIAI